MSIAAKRTIWAAITLCVWTLAGMSIEASALASTGYHLSGQFSTSEGTEPKGLAVDSASGDVYVAAPFRGFNPGLGGVEQFSASGTLLKTFETVEPQFSGVAVDPSTHDVYAYDDGHQLIDAFSSSGNPADVFGGSSSSSLPVTGGEEVEVQIASDSSGDIYYPNQALGEVQEFLPDGAPGPVTITGLTRPTYVSIASTRIYVVDSNSSTGASQVQQFDSSGAAAGSGVLGSGVVSNPTAVADDSSGDVFVVDQTEGGAVVDEFDDTETLIRTFGAGIITTAARSGATAITVNPSSGNVYVLEDAPPAFPPATASVLIFGLSSVAIPAATTGKAVAVEPSVETVTGTVNPQGTDTKYYFQYGMSAAYGQSTPGADAGSGTTSVAAETILSNLEPNQTYHYRLVVTNAEGDRAYGADQSFITQGAPPLVSGERASGATSTNAELEAHINPNNQATTYYFRYSTSPMLEGAATAPTSPGPEVGSGFREYPVSQDIGGLSPSTTYYYQVLATNATHTSEGPIESFTTLPKAPGAETEMPSLITETTATLNGVLTTQDVSTTYAFQYVDDADFKRSGYEHATSVPQPELYAGGSTQPIPATTFASGLTPDTSYHVRLVADNAGGFTEGPEQIFTTVVLPPSLSTGLSVSIAPTEATVNGGVNPEHGETTYRFEYVDEADFLSSGYQNAINAPQPEGDAGSADEPRIVTGAFSGLSPATAYHYRLVATNAGGSTTGAEQSFSTPTEGGSQGAPSSPFGDGATVPLAGIGYPDLAGLAPVPTHKQIASARTTAPSCLAKAERVTKGKRRKAALKMCEKKKKKKKARKPYGSKTRPRQISLTSFDTP